MALNKNTLKDALLQAMNDASNVDNTTPLQRRQLLAQKFADAIDDYVKSGDGKYQGGTLIAGTNAVTAVGGSGVTVIKLQ